MKNDIEKQINVIDTWIKENRYEDTFLQKFWNGCKSNETATLHDFYVVPFAPYQNVHVLQEAVHELKTALQAEPATESQQRKLFSWYKMQKPFDVNKVFELSYGDALLELKRMNLALFSLKNKSRSFAEER